MKLLLLDIETAPNTAYVWGLFDQNISHDKVIESSYILCWSAKWLGDRTIHYKSIQHNTPLEMLADIHVLLEEADVVIHFNGTRFDMPTLNKEFIRYNFEPPSPYRQVDVYREVKKSFRFESNKMDAISKALGLGSKIKHAGFELWVKCMEKDPKAWMVMKRYNIQDVKILEKLYLRLRPWMPAHPHLGLIEDKQSACPRCATVGKLQHRGISTTNRQRYQRYQCQKCGAWCRSRLCEKGKAPQYV